MLGADNAADDATGECTAQEQVCRTGTLYFYHNTVIVKDYRNIPQGSDWIQDRIFELSVAEASADIRNNIFYLYAPNGHPNLTLMARHGTADLNGTKWISAGWVEHIYETDYNHWTGTVNYNGTLIEGALPGFENIGSISGDLSGDDYSLTKSSPARDRATAIAPQVTTLDYHPTLMYKRHQSYEPRSLFGPAMDLGALEFGPNTKTRAAVAASIMGLLLFLDGY